MALEALEALEGDSSMMLHPVAKHQAMVLSQGGYIGNGAGPSGAGLVLVVARSAVVVAKAAAGQMVGLVVRSTAPEPADHPLTCMTTTITWTRLATVQMAMANHLDGIWAHTSLIGDLEHPPYPESLDLRPLVAQLAQGFGEEDFPWHQHWESWLVGSQSLQPCVGSPPPGWTPSTRVEWQDLLAAESRKRLLHLAAMLKGKGEKIWQKLGIV